MQTLAHSANVCGCESLWLITVFVLSADAGSGSGDDGKITHLIHPPPPPLLHSAYAALFLICFSLSSLLQHKKVVFPQIEHKQTQLYAQIS